ncbi:hypothetical protein MTP99_002635 [Tenebrio molitor]|jgi:hypothetical protein|nr:hypothetical protein MTP99_002635 [Tenebrio molitor]
MVFYIYTISPNLQFESTVCYCQILVALISKTATTQTIHALPPTTCSRLVPFTILTIWRARIRSLVEETTVYTFRAWSPDSDSLLHACVGVYEAVRTWKARESQAGSQAGRRARQIKTPATTPPCLFAALCSLHARLSSSASSFLAAAGRPAVPTTSTPRICWSSCHDTMGGSYSHSSGCRGLALSGSQAGGIPKSIYQFRVTRWKSGIRFGSTCKTVSGRVIYKKFSVKILPNGELIFLPLATKGSKKATVILNPSRILHEDCQPGGELLTRTLVGLFTVTLSAVVSGSRPPVSLIAP